MKEKIQALFDKEDGQTKMALDLVEPGDDSDRYGRGERVTKTLPSGITSRMLYNDIVRIAWPSFVELTLTQLASMVDLMMVGSLGPWAISSVGLTMQPKFLMMTAFIAMNVGATALIARAKGQDKPERANTVLNQAMFLTFILSLSSAIIGYVLAEPMVRFMGAADAQTLEGGTVYLKIQMLGFVPLALTSTITAALRGIGDSKTAMKYNLISNVVNVVFNYLLIFGHFGFPRMEVAGASLATIIGQVVAFILAIRVITTKGGYLYLSYKGGFRPQKKYLLRIINIGIPAMVEQLVMRAGIILYARTVASLGTLAFATHQVCMNITALSFMNGQAFAVSATSLMGQSLGKKRPDMAQAYSRRTRRLGMYVSIFLGIIFFVFGKPIIALYTDDMQVISQGAEILKVVALIQPLQSSQFILAGALRGAGDTRATAIVTFITILLIRPGLASFGIRVLGWGLMGAWLAYAADQLVRTLLIFMRFNSGKWKEIKV